jgi:hypothetical protein
MKKTLRLSALVGTFLAVLLLSGCGTMKIIASDATVPEDSTAVIYSYSKKQAKIDGITLKLKSLDGKSLPKGFHNQEGLRVPAGEHSFVVDAKWYSGLEVVRPEQKDGPHRQFFSKKKVHFSYDFKAGVSYFLEPALGGGEGAEVKLPQLIGSFTGPKRVGGEPFIGQIKVFTVTEYDKYAAPIVSKDAQFEVIGFDPEVSF